MLIITLSDISKFLEKYFTFSSFQLIIVETIGGVIKDEPKWTKE